MQGGIAICGVILAIAFRSYDLLCPLTPSKAQTYKVHEGMDLLERARASRQREQTSFLHPCPSYRLPQEGVTQIKDGPSHLKDLDYK